MSRSEPTPVRLTTGPRTAAAIREAAADLFYQHSYEATTLRQVAARVGITVGSLYNHISGKQALLASLMLSIMEDLLAAQEHAITGRSTSLDRLGAGLDCHIRFHAERARDVFIGNSELRALEPEDRDKIVSSRDVYEQTLRRLIAEACQDAGVKVLDLRLQTYAVLAAGIHVSSWYRAEGPLELDEIVQIYTVILLRQLGITPPAGTDAAR
ncbi:TetR/AcrR family transcriptional regulator [Actinomadura scrupuli]|uniref:TetR/AcrR family transcriptional regulator n=1 Tax=Actinomadura scrupuli TaxID=559629 RepID=UPI003D9913CF